MSFDKYIKDGWVLDENGWLHKEPGLGIHLDEDGNVDMMYNCPYIPMISPLESDQTFFRTSFRTRVNK